MAKKPPTTPVVKLTEHAESELKQGFPVMTVPLALVFAKMLHVGCPPAQAVLYCCPTVSSMDDAKIVMRNWVGDRLVKEAVDKINGGAWMDMRPEDRMTLARAKHIAEAAYYLWTTNFAEVEGREALDKMKMARELLEKELGLKVDDDPMAAFARFAMDMVKANQDMASQSREVRKMAKGQTQPDLTETSLSRLLSGPAAGKA